MNLQETLLDIFGTNIKRSDFLTSWHMKELKTFSNRELRELLDTAIFFSDECPALSSKIKGRVGVEWFNRIHGERKKIRVKKSKGKRDEERNRRSAVRNSNQ